jgi:Pvc16 N-terminal domain
MFIRMVDDALERLLRARLPLPNEVGDVSFDPPNSTWSAQLSRITVNLFLYDIVRSGVPARAITQRVDANGRAERRPPQPMVQLGYLVSAWAGSPRDEHQLLGDVISALAGMTTLPAEYLAGETSSAVQLTVAEDERSRPRDVWTSAGGNLKACFAMQVTAAADAFEWQSAPPAVERIETLARAYHGSR